MMQSFISNAQPLIVFNGFVVLNKAHKMEDWSRNIPRFLGEKKDRKTSRMLAEPDCVSVFFFYAVILSRAVKRALRLKSLEMALVTSSPSTYPI